MITCKIDYKPYSQDNLLNSIPKLRALTRENLATTFPKIQKIFLESGIALVALPYMKNLEDVFINVYARYEGGDTNKISRYTYGNFITFPRDKNSDHPRPKTAKFFQKLPKFIINAVPISVFFGQISPSSSAVEYPQNCIEYSPRI